MVVLRMRGTALGAAPLVMARLDSTSRVMTQAKAPQNSDQVHSSQGFSRGFTGMDPSSASARKPPRGIYLLPNLFTTGAMFAGFYAIVASIGGRYVAAAVAVFVAGILDGLDGRVARLTGTQSEFGVQYDSLSDMVSFGLAPALVHLHVVARLAEGIRLGLGQDRLGRRVHLRRVRGAPARALQYAGRRRRQALFPGTREPGRRRPLHVVRLDRRGVRLRRIRRAVRDAVPRRHQRTADGQPRALLQLQGVAEIRPRAVHLDSGGRADHRRALHQHLARAVRHRLVSM